MRARLTIVLCLAASLTLCLAGDSAAATKIDLTEYLDGTPDIGDFKVYNRSDGATQSSTLVDLMAHKKFTDYLFEDTEDATTDREVGETVHGKETRAGSVFFPDGTSFVVSKPKRIQSFQVVRGVPQKYKIGMTVMYQGHRVGKATLAGSSTFVGFESLTGTPFGSFDNVAHFQRQQTLTLKVGGDVFQSVQSSESWTTLQIGTVIRTRVGQSFKDGTLLENIGPYTYTFDHGVYHGNPYGMPVTP